MTEKRFFSKVKPDRLLLLLLSALLIGLSIKNANFAAEQVRRALLLCVQTVIPSIFPCTVISGIFVALGGGKLIGDLAKAPVRALFGISGAGASVLLLGWFCGFPVGALTGAELVRRGELSRNELSRLMLFANIPSPAFVISAVGESMLGDKSAGIMLYLTLLAVSLITGIIQKFVFKSNPEKAPKYSASLPPENPIVSSLCSSGISMLNLCSNIVFFSVITEITLSLFSFSSPLFPALLHGIFELSGGCAAASALGSEMALPLCAFILGWSGFGVHFQIISACGHQKDLPAYFFVKLLHGLVCAAAVFVFTLTL
jgi:hypothetical protein